MGYLLKPFDYAEFLQTAEKALQLSSSAEKDLSSPTHMFVKADYRQIKIMFDDILYLEGLKDYVKLYLVSQAQPIVTLMSLKKFEEQLPPERFICVHRSFIVALDKVEVVERQQIIFGKQRITVSDSIKEEFFSNLQINK